ncbi:MAG TPA: class IV adenylate cyclase [Pyrinomonadaceae bacterium]|jgi:adenylate cyclase class 2
MAIETEKKYRLDKQRRPKIIAKLKQLGAEFLREDFEENYLHRGNLLEERNAILRLRKIGETAILTYKERLKNGDDDFKQKIEFETEVADVAATENIIEKLGYRLNVVYEKRRQVWHFDKVEVVMDDLPFGLYMEIEGEIDDINEAEKLLEIEDLEPEPRGYPRLTAKLGKQKGNVFEARFD